MTQFFNNAEEAIAGVLQDGMLLHAGGFGLCGIPENIISAIAKSGVKYNGLKNLDRKYGGFVSQ